MSAAVATDTRMRRHRWASGLLLAALAGWSLLAVTAGAADGTALRLEVRGAIGPATSGFISKGLAKAAEENHRLVILEMDTPGGLDSAMRDIIKEIIASKVPVVTWVSPGGSRAASAGTYILYASHVAAMAPATNLGAATPVQIGGDTPVPDIGSRPAPDDKEKDKDKDTTADKDQKDAKTRAGDKPADADDSPVKGGSAMERKSVNDAVAYIRSLAQLRGRNADWAERAVTEAASLQAEAALQEKVIDVIAANMEQLLTAIDGRTVKVGEVDVKIETAGLAIVDFEPDWRTQLLQTITDPNVAYLLMLVGIYGLIFEGYSPGAILPGVVGAICLLLALFAFQVLSVNYAGLALIGLGIVLLIAEALAPGFGVLGLGGVIAFVIGSVILLDSPVPGMQVSVALIGGIAFAASVAMLATLVMLGRIRRRPVVSGSAGMIGEHGEVLADFNGEGDVFVHGERWKARAQQPLHRGERIRVTGIDGLVLQVEPDRRP